MSWQILDADFNDITKSEYGVKLNVLTRRYELLVEEMREITGTYIHLSLSESVLALPKNPRERPFAILETFSAIMKCMIKEAKHDRSLDPQSYRDNMVKITMENFLNTKVKVVTVLVKDLMKGADDIEGLKELYPDNEWDVLNFIKVNEKLD